MSLLIAFGRKYSFLFVFPIRLGSGAILCDLSPPRSMGSGVKNQPGVFLLRMNQPLGLTPTVKIILLDDLYISWVEKGAI